MKVPQHKILASVDPKITASEDLEEEVKNEISHAKASENPPKNISDLLNTTEGVEDENT